MDFDGQNAGHFILFVIEGLSLLLKKKMIFGAFVGLKITDLIRLTHLLFVDDVLIFGRGVLSDWQCFANGLTTFSQAP